MSADGEDRGTPIYALAQLRVEPDEEFGARLGRRIQRRMLAADLSRFTFAGLAHGFVQFLTALIGLSKGSESDEEGKSS